MIKFSIITCTYNSADYLAQNIASVRGQAYSEWEHIFIDGNSTDGTMKIIQAYQAELPDKVVVLQFPPKGISNAMNMGITAATGEYIIFVHSDDGLYDNAVLSDIAAYLGEHPVDWLYGKILVRDQSGDIGFFPTRSFFQNYGGSRFFSYVLKFYNFIPHQAVCMKKQLLLQVKGFDESITSSMDYDVWLRVRKSSTWRFFDRTVCRYSIRAGSQSANAKLRKQNEANLRLVQRRYVHAGEFILARIFNFIIGLRNKNYR